VEAELPPAADALPPSRAQGALVEVADGGDATAPRSGDPSVLDRREPAETPDGGETGGGGAAEEGGQPGEDQRCPLLDDGTVLVVDTYGAILGKHSERLRVRLNKQIVREAPLFQLRQVLLTSKGILASTDAMRECAERGIPLHLISGHGELVGTLASPVGNATAATRREQLLAYLDERGRRYARAVVLGKLRNQANLLKYANKYRKSAAPDAYEVVREAALAIEQLALEAEALDGDGVDALRPRLLNLEGRAGHRYWQAVAALLKPRLPDWPGRTHREATDPFNAALNYGYAILGTQVHDALLAAGLDPAAGFLHTDRAGKRSLVYDLIEEFRQAAVDRSLLALVNRQGSLRLDEGLLDRASKQRVAAAVLDRLASAEVYEGKRHSLRAIIWRQAQHLATFLRRERATYAPFVARW
jgi:CRISPR-associated protein Cas1